MTKQQKAAGWRRERLPDGWPVYRLRQLGHEVASTFKAAHGWIVTGPRFSAACKANMSDAMAHGESHAW